jgi:nitrogen regulatory protein P-II 1
MKMITAIINPEKLESVHDELKKSGINYITVMETKASAIEGGFSERYRGSTYAIDYYDFTRIDVVVDDDKLDTAVNIILDVTTADDKAIGRIFTSTIDDSINIATHKNRSDAVA